MPDITISDEDYVAVQVSDTVVNVSVAENPINVTINDDSTSELYAFEELVATTYIPLSYIDTDGTLVANSDTKLASQKAVKTYVDAQVGAENLWNRSGTTLSPNTANDSVNIGTGTMAAGVYLGPDGSLSAPTYSFSNSTNTGMYFNGTSLVADVAGVSVARFISTGPLMEVGVSGGGSVQFGRSGGNGTTSIRDTSGVVRVSLNSASDSYITSGNLGVGTNLPSRKLHVVSSTAQDGIWIDSPTYPDLQLLRSGVSKGTIGIAGVAGGFGSGTLVDSLIIRSENAIHLLPNGGTNAMTVATTGNIGIGTTSPLVKLHVSVSEPSGAAAPQLASDSGLVIDDTNAPNIQFRSNTTGVNYIFFGDDDADVGSLRYDHTSNFMGFRVNASDRMIVNSSGNVGIGTATPLAKLHVAQDSPYTAIADSPSLTLYNSTLSSANLALGVNGSASNTIQSRDGTSSSWPLSINPFGGAVSIGSTTGVTTNSVGLPQFGAYSDLYSSIASIAHNNTNGNHGFVLVGKARGTKASPTIIADGDVFGEYSFVAYDGSSYRTSSYIRSKISGAPGASDLPTQMEFAVAADGSATPTVRMAITPAGNIGIGTTAPSEKLDVVGNIEIQNGGYIKGDTYSGSRITIDNDLTIQANRDVFIDTGVVFKESGNIGIGTTSPNEMIEMWNGKIRSSNSSTGNYGRFGMTSGNLVIDSFGNPSNIYLTPGTASDVVITAGKLGVNTTSPTHTITLPSTSTGYVNYNTADQTTNYERGIMYWSGNNLYIGTEKAGTGNRRALRLTTGDVLASGNRTELVMDRNSNTRFSWYASNQADNTANLKSFLITTVGGFTQTSGTNIQLSVEPTYNQTSGTAANTDLLINRTETAVGSGAQLLIDAQVGGTSKFKVDNVGKITSTATAINIATQTPASASATGTAGDIAWDSNYVYVCTATNTWKRVAIATW